MCKFENEERDRHSGGSGAEVEISCHIKLVEMWMRISSRLPTFGGSSN